MLRSKRYRMGGFSTIAVGVSALALLVSACGGAAPTPAPTATKAAVTPTASLAAPTATKAATAGPSPTAAAPTATKPPAPTPTLAVPTAIPTPTIAPSANIRRGGTLRANYGPMIAPMTPHTVVGGQRLMYLGPPHSELLTWEHKKGSTKLVGDLAESWTVSADGLLYTVKLRQGVKWHNRPPVNGRLFKSSDVVFSLKHEMDTSAGKVRPQAGALQMIESVTATDDYTVQFKLKYASSSFLPTLSSPFRFIVPKELFDQLGDDFKSPLQYIGTGPYVGTDYQPQVRMIYRANPDYYVKGLPYLDEVQILPIDDGTAEYAALLTGKIDITGLDHTSQKWEEAQASGRVAGEMTRAISVRILALNSGSPITGDVRIRKAIQLAVDTPRIWEVYTGSIKYSEHGGPVPPVLGDWVLPLTELPTKRDLAQARQLIKDAGYSGAVLRQISPSDGTDETGPLIQAHLAEVGLKTQLIPSDTSSQMKAYGSGAYELGYRSIGASSTNPNDFLFEMFHSKGNRAKELRWSTPAYDALVDRIFKELDETKRRDMVMEAQRMLIREAPVAAINYPFLPRSWSLKLQNYIPGLTWGWESRTYQHVWFKE